MWRILPKEFEYDSTHSKSAAKIGASARCRRPSAKGTERVTVASTSAHVAAAGRGSDRRETTPTGVKSRAEAAA